MLFILYRHKPERDDDDAYDYDAAECDGDARDDDGWWWCGWW